MDGFGILGDRRRCLLQVRCTAADKNTNPPGSLCVALGLFRFQLEASGNLSGNSSCFLLQSELSVQLMVRNLKF